MHDNESIEFELPLSLRTTSDPEELLYIALMHFESTHPETIAEEDKHAANED